LDTSLVMRGGRNGRPRRLVATIVPHYPSRDMGDGESNGEPASHRARA
jgi:hypothetical protein